MIRPKKLLAPLLGILGLGLLAAYGHADAPAITFFNGTAGIQIPGIDDWRQANRWDFKHGQEISGVEGAWAHVWYFQSYIGGAASPSAQASSVFNGYGTIDFDFLDYLHSYGIISDKLRDDLEVSGYVGGQFVNPDVIYGVAFKLKI